MAVATLARDIPYTTPAGTLVNDIHSQLNPTRVHAIIKPRTLRELRSAVLHAKAAGRTISIAGGRHAMGGQQFGEGSVLIDTRALARAIALDRDCGLLTVEGGIQWPAILRYLEQVQTGDERQWGIFQKQTGADRLSLAGALSCNAHGRGLTLGPIVQQVESFDLMDQTGEVRTCSRRRNRELFSLAIGGYGLFGIITRVMLRLRPRVKVRRVVVMGETRDIPEWFEARIRDGFLYGDYQFAIDDADETFLRRGVFSCYQPVADDTPLTVAPIGFSSEDWSRLVFHAHADKRRAFDLYAARYLATSGQIYYADSQLSAAYLDDYHVTLDAALGAPVRGSEMITELYVPPESLPAFIEDARTTLRRRRANVIYGTVRLIEKDAETFLPWARERYGCIVFNLHVDHTESAIRTAAETFRDLIDLAISRSGTYYLTYHRWARKDQVLACYPQMPEFLEAKRHFDPCELFQSEWYRHYRRMFASDGDTRFNQK